MGRIYLAHSLKSGICSLRSVVRNPLWPQQNFTSHLLFEDGKSPSGLGQWQLVSYKIGHFGSICKKALEGFMENLADWYATEIDTFVTKLLYQLLH